MTLYKLAELGAYQTETAVSTGIVAKSLDLSQQTASRRMIEMEKKGLIERTVEGRVQKVRITKEGANSLAEMYRVLKPVIEAPSRDLALEGAVFSGLSEGSYYMGLEGYRRQFRSKLGFDPFPGTLNLRVAKDSMTKRKELDGYHFIAIDGFADKDRTYGGARCYPVTVQDKVKGAIVVPIRAHYQEDVIEIIAPQNLRKLLQLQDGDLVDVTVPFEH